MLTMQYELRYSYAVEILILSVAFDFLTKSMGMARSVGTAQQACSTEMVKSVVTMMYDMNENAKQGQLSRGTWQDDYTKQ